MPPQRRAWLWGAAALECLAGIIAGPALYAAVTSVQAAFQPRTFVSGWDVIALLAVIGALWVGAGFVVARRLGGKAGIAFAVAAAAVAGAAILYERLLPLGAVIQGTMTGEDAAAWRDFRP